MLILASVFCVLLGTAASSPVDSVAAAWDLFDTAIQSAIVRAGNSHDAATTYVNALLSQIRLEIPLDSQLAYLGENTTPNQAPSPKCYEFLKERVETSRSLVAECSQGHLKLITNQRQRIEKFFNHVLKRLEEHDGFIVLCMSTYKDLPDSHSKAASCIQMVQQDMEATIKQVEAEFRGMALTAKKVAATWVSDAGRCAASKENPSHELDWFKACKIKN